MAAPRCTKRSPRGAPNKRGRRCRAVSPRAGWGKESGLGLRVLLGTKPGLTRMRPLVVKRQTPPESGCFCFFSRVANLTREQSNGLLCAFLRVQKGTQCSRFLVPRCDVHDLKTLERVLLKLCFFNYSSTTEIYTPPLHAAAMITYV